MEPYQAKGLNRTSRKLSVWRDVVDGQDAVRLMKFLAGEEDPETGKVYEISKKSADVNADGKVDEKDLLRLVQYLCGMPVTLEEGPAE